MWISTKLGVTDSQQRVSFNITQFHDSLLTILILHFNLIFIVLYLWLYCQSLIYSIKFFLLFESHILSNIKSHFHFFIKYFPIFYSYEVNWIEISDEDWWGLMKTDDWETQKLRERIIREQHLFMIRELQWSDIWKISPHKYCACLNFGLACQSSIFINPYN